MSNAVSQRKDVPDLALCTLLQTPVFEAMVRNVAIMMRRADMLVSPYVRRSHLLLFAEQRLLLIGG